MYEETKLELKVGDYRVVVYETTPTRLGEPRSLAWEVWDLGDKVLWSSDKEYKLNGIQSALQDALDKCGVFVRAPLKLDTRCNCGADRRNGLHLVDCPAKMGYRVIG